MNYNDNIGRKYKAPFIKDNLKAFTASSDLSELEELKRAIRLTKMDIANNRGNRENLLVDISAYEKRKREIEEININQSQVSELSDDVVIKIIKETEVIYYSSEPQKVEEKYKKEYLVSIITQEKDAIGGIELSSESPKVDDKYKREPIPNSSSAWKKIDFSGKTQYKHPNIEVLKSKKPWWKFW